MTNGGYTGVRYDTEQQDEEMTQIIAKFEEMQLQRLGTVTVLLVKHTRAATIMHFMFTCKRFP